MSDKTVKHVDIHVGAPGAERVPGLFDRISHSIHEMNREANQSAFHGLEKILKGGGVAAAVYFGAEAIKKAADAWKDYAEGMDDTSDMLIKMAKSIPVLGQVVDLIESAGNAIKTSQYYGGSKWLPQFLQMSDEQKEQYKTELNRPGLEQRQKAQEAWADAMANKGWGYEKGRGGGLYGRRDDLEADIKEMQRVLQTNAAINNLTDVAETMTNIGIEKAIKELYQVRDEITHREGSFMRRISTGINQFISYGWREVAFTARQAIRDAVNAANSRQDEIDLEAWRSGAEAQKAAEESFMSDAQLDLKRRKEALLKIAGDDRVSDDLRKKALQGANNLSGIYTSGGYSPNISGNLLTGAHAASGETRANDEAKTAKNTAETASATTKALEHLKTIAEALSKNPRTIIGIGL